MYLIEIVESDAPRLSQYAKLIPIESFAGFVDSADFEEGQSVTYRLFQDDSMLYEGVYFKGGATLAEDIRSKLAALVSAGESLDDINKVAAAFDLGDMTPKPAPPEPRPPVVETKPAADDSSAELPPRQFRIRPWVLGIIAAVVLVLGVGLVYHAKQSESSNIRPKYSELVAKGDYRMAARFYPQKRESLEAKLLAADNLKGLKALSKEYTDDQLSFDLAFLKKDWAGVVGHSDFSLDMTHKAKLAIAYVYAGEPKQALTINEELKSKTLTELVFITMLHLGQLDTATQVAKQIGTKDADTLLQAAKTYQTAYEKADQDATNPKLSKTQRRQATRDRDNWLALRKSLGGKTKYE